MHQFKYPVLGIVFCLTLIYAAIGIGWVVGPKFLDEQSNLINWVIAFGAIAGPVVTLAGFWLILGQLRHQEFANKIAMRETLSQTLREVRIELELIEAIKDKCYFMEFLTASHDNLSEEDMGISLSHDNHLQFHRALLLLQDPERPYISHVKLRYHRLIFDIANAALFFIEMLPSYFAIDCDKNPSDDFLSCAKNDISGFNEAEFEKFVAASAFLDHHATEYYEALEAEEKRLSALVEDIYRNMTSFKNLS